MHRELIVAIETKIGNCDILAFHQLFEIANPTK
jgi:hypothetical protein